MYFISFFDFAERIVLPNIAFLIFFRCLFLVSSFFLPMQQKCLLSCLHPAASFDQPGISRLSGRFHSNLPKSLAGLFDRNQAGFPRYRNTSISAFTFFCTHAQCPPGVALQSHFQDIIELLPFQKINNLTLGKQNKKQNIQLIFISYR
jgi:hypothetical protein